MQFLDEVKIYVEAGRGGNGCVSFRREKFLECGGPDGGKGGNGGDIILRSKGSLNTLIDFRYKQHFKAGNGRPGSGRNKTGARGKDIYLDVPVGTQVFDEDGEMLVDLNKEDIEVILIKGGLGGAGNAIFKNSTNQAPREFKPGEKGEAFYIVLKLKLLSDVGLLGLPNAGKSTFLNAVSNAKSRVGNYPFTTLHPLLGAVRISGKDFVIADLPGLIKGASQGVGLGYRFLKHIERCKVLVHLIDITSDVIEDYKTIERETSSYGIKNKTKLIVLNKVDLLTKEEVKEKVLMLEKYLKEKILISSSFNKSSLKKILRTLISII